MAGSGRIGASDGVAELATFSAPHSVLPLADGSCIVSDCGNDSVRHVSADANGDYTVQRVGPRGFGWLRPKGLALLPDGGVLVCDSGHNRVRLLGADGRVSIFAGSGRRGLQDGNALEASFDGPCGLGVCADGTVLVCDTGNHCLRAVFSNGGRRTVRTLAGTGAAGSGDGAASLASFDSPSAVLALGGADENASVVYVADSANHCIRIITTPKDEPLSVGTLAGTPGLSGCVDGPLNESLFGCPAGLALGADGALLVSDSYAEI